MAISRPVLLAVLGAALVAATFLSAQNARNRGSQDAVPAAHEGPSTEEAAASEQPPASAAETLRSALSGELSSAAFDVKLELAAGGDSAKVRLSGAFERGATGDFPAVLLEANIRARGREIEGGFVAVDENAYLTRGDDAWRMPAEAWDPVVRAVADAGGPAQAPLAIELRPESWVRDARIVGEERLDGVETTHVSASVDVAAIVRDLAAARGAGAQLPPPRQIAASVERAELDAWVGSDRILRRLTARLAFDAPRRLRSSKRPAHGRIDLAVDLSAVNETQRIEAPAKVLDGLPGGRLGRVVEGFAAGLSGMSGGQPLSLAALATDNPKKAARAVRAGKKVVIFFRNPRGLDDRAVARSVAAVERRSNAVVLTDHVDAVERYGRLVEELGVSQTPSVVLIDTTGNARLIEGFIDSSSLTQAVADAR